MRRRQAGSHDSVARPNPNECIEQAVAVQMSQLMPAGSEADATKAMHTERNPQRTARLDFEEFPHRQAAPIKESRRYEQHRVEDLRQERHAREPAQSSDNKGENHEAPPLLNLRKQEGRQLADFHAFLLH